MDLDELPLDVLLALQDALTDPSEEGAKRARKRAAGVGFHVELGNEIDGEGRVVLGQTPVPPVPQPEAEPGVDAIELHMDERSGKA